MSEDLLVGTLKFLSRLVSEFNTIVFRKDKCGIILKVIIRTFKIRVVWGLTMVPIGPKKGRYFPDLLQCKICVK